MEDIVKNDVLDIARLLEDHRAEQVMALYIGEMSDWTDYFIISTVRSAAHLKGLLRLLSETFAQKSISPLRPRKLHSREAGWVLIDCGRFVVHLMDREHREFYELEKLWFKNELIYSSKSS
ncbi:MAG: ribosome silencing factor [Spirochaetaceae bacterium]|nr:MAG: ribosome silencing factor [Spirochaetaceae bacterium]